MRSCNGIGSPTFALRFPVDSMAAGGITMPRYRRPSYFRSLVFLMPGLFAGGIAFFVASVDKVRCSVLPASMQCDPMLPAWAYLAAGAVVMWSIAYTAWAFYKDHARGDYMVDILTQQDRYRD
jgi:hypothetical protein